ncbi:MAG: D-arabinono-1,4-lactone oxidase [Alcanivoracaceae bacterium]|nr:D-arabinono-1,4-lactone oxidase [Alcanivoracaceae bacterium]
MMTINLQRRALLKAMMLGAGAMALPGRLLANAGSALHWQNWSGNQVASPEAMHFPMDEDALRQILKAASGTVRVFGGSHSFSGLVPTDHTMISLEGMSGMRRHNADALTASFGPGTRIGMASAQNWEIGQSFMNEPDINLQSLAGAVATSTHGTGTSLPSLSGMLAGMRLMTVDGEVLELSEADGDLFRAACASLGALGIVTELTFKNVPAYRLQDETRVMGLRDAMDLMEREHDKTRNLEFFAFPRGETAIVKITRTTDEPDTPPAEADSNELLELASDVSMKAPWLIPAIQKAVTFFVEEEIRRGPAHVIYAQKRSVPFNEMEYTVPLDKGLECLEEVCAKIRNDRMNVFFPIEFRYTAADNSLIGMFRGRPGASISVHQYHRQEYNTLFNAVEPIMQRYEGRPHWGKLHTMDAASLANVHPGLETFRTLRRQLDPQGKLLNAHLRHILGEPAA